MKRVFTVREVIKILEKNGWFLDRFEGSSHRQFKHPIIHTTVTVNGKLSDDIWIDNLKSIERQSGIKIRE
jgi:predicted RNA binding protein YcfA (HicA-like mRNA interferase family)